LEATVFLAPFSFPATAPPPPPEAARKPPARTVPASGSLIPLPTPRSSTHELFPASTELTPDPPFTPPFFAASIISDNICERLRFSASAHLSKYSINGIRNRAEINFVSLMITLYHSNFGLSIPKSNLFFYASIFLNPKFLFSI
jgi:hypothetical protein